MNKPLYPAELVAPRYIKIDPNNDNVAIVVNDFGLPAKTPFNLILEVASGRTKV